MSTASKINERFQADLIVLPKLSRSNSNYKYLLTAIDVLSKYAFVFPIKRKKGPDVRAAFEKLFSKTSFKYLQVDKGLEFYNKYVQSLMKDHNVCMYSIYSDKKASVIEAFNRTIMNKIQKYLTYNNTKRFVDVLPDLVNSYNNSVHSATKMKPSSVNENNQMLAWMNAFGKKLKNVKIKQVYNQGDFVRIKIYKNVFDKGYSPNFSNETYVISKVNNSIPITYKLSNNNGEIIGSFYTEELSKIVI